MRAATAVRENGVDTEYWRERWRNGEISFHRTGIHPALEAWWPTSVPEPSAPVLVPLCGKSLDMRWLVRRGHAVTGVELEEAAVIDFFREWQVPSSAGERADGLVHHEAAGVRLVAGDFFAFGPQQAFDAVYDRAALVALPPAMRRAYLRRLAGCVASGGRGLLITFEYVAAGFSGPPFAVDEAEVRDQPWFAVDCLERVPAGASYPGLVERGAHALHEVVYRLERTSATPDDSAA